MEPQIYTAAIDDRYEVGKVTSRIGLEAPARIFHNDTDLLQDAKDLLLEKKVDCILVDESQFLSKQHVDQLTHVVDELNIPVLCYGLRTDFLGELFEGAQYLLAWADKLIELKTVCHCGRKANMVLRTDENGKAIADGDQVQIGGNDRYVSMCRKHYKQALKGEG